MGLALPNQEDVMKLRKILEQIIDALIKMKLLPPNVDKNKLLDNVMENLKKNDKFFLNKDSLKDPKIHNTLAVACVGQHLLGDKFDSSLLLTPKMALTPHDLTAQLKVIFNKMLENKLDGKNISPEEKAIMQKKLDAFAQKLAPELLKSTARLDKNAMVMEDKTLMKTLAAGFDADGDLKRQFYGTDKPGAEPVPVFTAVGNLIGALDLETDTSKPSFMGEIGSTAGDDPLGTKFDNLVSEVAKGSALIDTPAELKIVEEIINIASPKSAPTPFSTKPKPPGALDD